MVLFKLWQESFANPRLYSLFILVRTVYSTPDSRLIIFHTIILVAWCDLTTQCAIYDHISYHSKANTLLHIDILIPYFTHTYIYNKNYTIMCFIHVNIDQKKH